eukprot:TRINITY_DN28723_c1_g1_i1.p1 TRINITY_DN28723_c1_g1~~TRINITY_DN28723_c1_g1_i1.p1  ORF type:complete len:2542 (+),score=518.11 TRINITY_DN28723_c1_g1_i1:69-7694(+)
MPLTVRSIADDVATWITTGSGSRPRMSMQPMALLRASSKGCDIFLSYAAPWSADFARAVVARLRLEKPTLKAVVQGEDERKDRANKILKRPEASISSSCTSSRAVLVALTPETFSCPLVCREIVTCLQAMADKTNTKHAPRIAFIYHVRSGRGQSPDASVAAAPIAVQQVLCQDVAADVPIFEYLHEYDDLCMSAVLHWLDGLPPVSLPSNSTLARLQSATRSVANLLSAPALPNKLPAAVPSMDRKSILPPLASSSASPGMGFGLSASAVKPSRSNVRPVALGLLHTSCTHATGIAKDVSDTCLRAFGSTVRTESFCGETKSIQLESVANLLVIITPGALGPGEVLQQVTRALRAGPVNIVLLQDISTVPNIWQEFGKLPSELRVSIASIVALPYLKSHGFSACLTRLGSSDLLRPVDGPPEKAQPLAMQYGRASNFKLFDLFFCHFQRTGLDWAFAMRLSFLQHAGAGFRTLLDVQSLQNISECGRYVEQSHGLAVLVTPGIFTRFFCQRELLLARKSGVQIIFIQHMRTCIDIEQEVNRVNCTPEEFMSEHGEEYSRAGGTEADFRCFRQAMLQEIWTARFRPPVFSYVHELEAACVKEVVAYLRHRRKRTTRGAEKLDFAARAILDFLRMAPEDTLEVRAGLGAVANQAAAGGGEDFCAALVRVKALPVIAQSLEHHASLDVDVAYHGLRALRSIAATSVGSDALAQFASTEGALATLHSVLQKSIGDKRSDEHLRIRREGLEVLRALRAGGTQVQLAIQQTNLSTEIETLFRQLRSELEPLDEIRETLELAPVHLPELEIALESWHSRGEQNLDQNGMVDRASSLLDSVRKLREAVANQDGESADVLLREQGSEVERCAGLADLLFQAKSAAAKFQEQRRVRDEQMRTEEEQARLRQQAESELEKVFEQLLAWPDFARLAELEAAIVAGHQAGCSLQLLEQSRDLLIEVRGALQDPMRFLKGVGSAVSRHANVTLLVLALLRAHPSDRDINLAGLQAVTASLRGQATAVQRAEVETALDVTVRYVNDIEVQTAGCRCISELLRTTRLRFNSISALALLEHPSTGQIKAVEVVLSALATAMELFAEGSVRQATPCLGAACECLLEIAMLGERAVSAIMASNGRSQVWRTLKTLAPEGRTANVDIVQTAVHVFEEMARHGGSQSSSLAREALLRLCDFYDRELHVCLPAVQALLVLFREQPSKACSLTALSYDDDEEPKSPLSPGSPEARKVMSCGLAVILRSARLHPDNGALQEAVLRIIALSLEGIASGAGDVDQHLCHEIVKLAATSLQLHQGDARVCTASAACLARIVDTTGRPACQQILNETGMTRLVNAMNKHPVEQELLQKSLRVLGVLTQFFPNETIGDGSVSAILTAMKAGFNDGLTQLCGCAALGSLAEQSGEVALKVGKQATDSILAAMGTFAEDLDLNREALQALWHLLSVKSEVALSIGERSRVVPRILEILPHLRKSAATRACAHRDGSSPEASPLPLPIRLRQRVKSGLDMEAAGVCLLMACRVLRVLCAARAATGPSFDLLFHRGVCSAAPVLSGLLGGGHDLEIEVLQLLHDVASADSDGAEAVGRVLAQPANQQALGEVSPKRRGVPAEAANFNLVIDALRRFHSDSDCVIIFSLIATLAACGDFAASTEASSVAEMLRLAAIYRQDLAVQIEVTRALAALLTSSSFDAQLLATTDGIESLLLTASRYYDRGDEKSVASMVQAAILELAHRSKARRFYVAFEAALRRQESSDTFVAVAGRALCAIFRRGTKDCAVILETGAMSKLLQGVMKHQKQPDVREMLPELCELATLRGGETMKSLLLKSEAPRLLVSVVTAHIGKELPASRTERMQSSHPRKSEQQAWYFHMTLAARRIDVARKGLQQPAPVAAAFRALRHLGTFANSWDTVEAPELVGTLLRVMAASSNDALLESSSALFADMLHLVEAHITWTSCITETGRQETRCLANNAREAIDNELLGLRQWKAGNFLAAATAFKYAEDKYARVVELVPQAKICEKERKALAEHLKAVQFKKLISICHQHSKMFAAATEAARTSVEIQLPSKNTDCIICLEALDPRSKPLWKCDKCHNAMHEACIAEWCKNKDSCPICRQGVKKGEDNRAYFRASLIAEAAESSLRGVSEGQDFLTNAVVSLWRSAASIGRVLGASPKTLTQVEERVRRLEAKLQVNGDSARHALERANAFEKAFVQPCELQAAQEGSGNLKTALALLGAVTTEVSQRRCATMAQQVMAWQADVEHHLEHNCFEHAEQQLVVIGGQLSSIADLSGAARLSDTQTLKEIDYLMDLRREVKAKRTQSQDASMGFAQSTKVPHQPVLPFSACLQVARRDSPVALNSLAALRAFTATSRAIRLVAAGDSSQAELARQAGSFCLPVITAILDDGLVSRLSTCVGGNMGRQAAFLSAAILRHLLHCGDEAKQASFSQLDRVVSAAASLSTRSSAADPELQTFLCGLAHDMIFSGGCEDRMVRRLQREAAPRESAALEEWFLDTVLVQCSAVMLRGEILQPKAEHDVLPEGIASGRS